LEHGKVVQKIVAYFPTLEAANLYCEKKGIRKFEAKNTIPPSLEKKIIEKFQRLNSARPLPESAVKKLKEKFEVDMTYNSNAIEGNRLTLRETWLVLRKGITIGGKTMEEHLEAKNHLEAIMHLYELAKARRKITEKDILELHRLVLSKVDEDIAGKYRTKQVYIEGAVHVPPPPNKVPRLRTNLQKFGLFGNYQISDTMKRALFYINKKDKGIDAIKTASKIHHMITWIHPFVDGNGRVARLLLNLKLMRAGFPPIVLRKGERKAYYSALKKADEGDLYPITTMIATNVDRSLDLWLSAI